MKSLYLKIILKVIGMALMFEALFMFAGILFSIYYADDDIFAIALSSLITALTGAVLHFTMRKVDYNKLGKREGYVIVALSWFVLGAFGALPFMVSGYIPSFTDAFFETASGFTTTGSSILTEIEHLPHGLLFWRSMTHWLGGLGVIVLVIAVLPYFGFGGMQLFVAEVTGPSKDKLHPRVTATARRIWGVYVLLTIILAILYLLGGMDLFESLCHTFGTMATGGFSPKNTSLAEYSPYIQWITTVFMVFAGTNFTLFYLLLKGRFRSVFRNEELHYYLSFFVLASVILTLLLVATRDYEFFEAARHASFQAISIISTTGYASDDFMLWPVFGYTFIFLLMFVGGMAGSTGGSIKVIRHVVLIKAVKNTVKKIMHPNAVIPITYNGRPVSQSSMMNIISVFLLFLAIFFVGSALLAIAGEGMMESVSGVAAAVCNIGPGLGTIGPTGNFAAFSDFSKWVLSVLMIMGRLELITVLIIVTPSFWRK
ncbi:MAG: potassium transporter [Bacteroidetes bacterium HGW-Bacteroidetes-6]|jgi:trk system potassium uptake protein TrkH|nr:MAG: potassium transporter [Bacteroidetes bacterium HGW-Bacteroidetes-6]